MEKIQGIDDVCKEVITVLTFFDKNLVKKIPTKVLKKLYELGAKSNYDVYIDAQKQLKEQKISEKSKDLLSILYYRYIADQNKKKELTRIWEENERIYQKELRKKYNPDDIFKKVHKQNSKEQNNNSLLNENKESFLTKIKSVFK